MTRSDLAEAADQRISIVKSSSGVMTDQRMLCDAPSVGMLRFLTVTEPRCVVAHATAPPWRPFSLCIRPQLFLLIVVSVLEGTARATEARGVFLGMRRDVERSQSGARAAGTTRGP